MDKDTEIASLREHLQKMRDWARAFVNSKAGDIIVPSTRAWCQREIDQTEVLLRKGS